MEGHLERFKRAAQAKSIEIPSAEVCLELLKRFGTYPHIIAHIKQVTKIAVFLGRELEKQGIRLNIPLIEAGALLHDIAKTYSIEHPGVDHAAKGAEWVRDLGYPEVAKIVAAHVELPEPIDLNEMAIVNYADKRVKHDQVVSLEERFEDLLVRYGKTEARRSFIKRLYARTKEVEEMIFKHLPFSPAFINSLGEDG